MMGDAEEEGRKVFLSEGLWGLLEFAVTVTSWLGRSVSG